MVKKILEEPKFLQEESGEERLDFPGCTRRCTWPVSSTLQNMESQDPPDPQILLTTKQLAVLVGSVPILQRLLKAEEDWNKPDCFGGCIEEDYPSFLLAAAMGNPQVIKAFLDSQDKSFDYNISDHLGNTPLHYALRGRYVQLSPHLVDFVGCSHVYFCRWWNDDWITRWLDKPLSTTVVQGEVEKHNKEPEDRHGQRRGAINLLLEAGIDVWAHNKEGRIASPDPDARTDARKDSSKWWYDEVATETKAEQSKLNNAANAISVTAALVATASGTSDTPSRIFRWRCPATKYIRSEIVRRL